MCFKLWECICFAYKNKWIHLILSLFILLKFSTVLVAYIKIFLKTTWNVRLFLSLLIIFSYIRITYQKVALQAFGVLCLNVTLGQYVCAHAKDYIFYSHIYPVPIWPATKPR